MDNKFKRLFGDTFLFAIGSFGSKFLVFFMLPLYTSVLTKNEYGTVDIVINAVNLLVPILTLSICDATLRFALSKNSDPRKVLSNSMLMLVIATIVLLVATPLVKFFWNTLYQNWWYLLAIFISTALHIEPCASFRSFCTELSDTPLPKSMRSSLLCSIKTSSTPSIIRKRA